ncbi:MAG TPA: transposase [Candidatus Binatia bacterium]|jgi:putative transposase|nr:transposase [Candidatus Binatia bacterium]
MSEYRRAYVPDGTYFFTVKTLERQPILTQEHYRLALREAIIDVRTKLPFQSLAWVLLPDHLHAIWKLPESDADFSMRWSLIKQHVTRQCADRAATVLVSQSRQRRREGTISQRRFWEHLIRDETDLERHVDYIHYNPVKHGYVRRTADWPYSTFHRYVRDGVYPTDWGNDDEPPHSNFGE